MGSRGELKPRFPYTFESCRGHQVFTHVRMAQSWQTHEIESLDGAGSSPATDTTPA
jgi:hypothetical protein